jgi:glycosyltransferase involved in cell wall biosynthesis
MTRPGPGRPPRVLFVNEGELGAGGVMGHAAADQALRRRLVETELVEGRFVHLPPLRGLAHLATLSFPLLGAVDLDLQPTRWHLVQSLRARRVVARELGAFPAEALHVESHAVSFALVEEMRRRPTFLSFDVSVTDWRMMGIWRPVRRHSAAAMAPSRAMERRVLAEAALVLAWTGWARAAAERACPAATVEEYHPGLDLDVFQPAERSERSKVRILFVGGRFAAKGGWDLLRALDGSLGKTVELDVVTPEELPARAGVRVHRLGIGDPRLVELYQQADVFCLPSYGDAAPLALVEAMACGCAVVSTSVGGIPELLGDGAAGVVVAPGDVAQLADVLEQLVQDPERRGELGRAARARCEERYDAARQTLRLVELIRSRL